MTKAQGGQITLKGLQDYHRGLRSLKSSEMVKVLKPAIRDASKKILVPEVKRGAKKADKYSPSRSRDIGKRGKKGPLVRKVTSKAVKKRGLVRNNALVAYQVASRAWYGGWVSTGTKPHSLKSKKGRKNPKTGRVYNEGRMHPGAKSNDYVARAQGTTAQRMSLRVHRAVFVNYKRQAKVK